MKNTVLTGLTVDTFRGIKPAVLLNSIRKVGVEFAEVTVSIFNDLKHVTRSIKGLKLGLHLPILSQEGYDFSCLEKRKEIEWIINQVNRNWRKLKFQYVLSHPTEDHLFETDCQVSEGFLFNNLRKLRAPVVLENTLETDSFRFGEFLKRAEKALGENLIGICYDGPHAFISRDDWFQMLEQYFPRIRLVHLSDCTKEEDLHIPFGGKGELPVEEILSFLRDRDYQGIVNLELLPSSLTDLGPVFESYLLILRYLNRRKYRRMRIKSAFLLPFLHYKFR